ncbi:MULTISPECIES: hypothetical protein [unclassified Bradyrhizobium]|uniref:hypothetical protein n=1 Tax=unclassified Bradyrhizobium TaxID=2631580 RepID=UPI001FF8B701|nr:MULTISPECIES: hypothetical protein [unclassified Bradyrhizobium]MCK1277669.1 hypothetical protein [Bradyrhizobium sp. 61]MCK1445687.1 hypothetical protein [Bradyrhizobium sp. 48]MCK1465395.1 hypothetical protein [Bradyrhizobium sp. 2]
MTQLDDRTLANLDFVLEEVCRPLPHGGDHELRKAIAEKLLASALKGNRAIGGLTEIARAALAEMTKKSA